MGKFMNKYRIASARASWWNYQWAGAYFITICTKDREQIFGEIKNGKMNLSPTGVLADIFWHQIPIHTQNVELGAFIVMPNHVHGIIILKNDGDGDDGNRIVQTLHVETLHATSLPEQPQPQPPQQSKNQSAQKTKNHFMSKISPKPNSISTIIRSYKSAVTRHANRLELPAGWQERFYDHIIRNDAEYQRINDYIENNPKTWDTDKLRQQI